MGTHRAPIGGIRRHCRRRKCAPGEITPSPTPSPIQPLLCLNLLADCPMADLVRLVRGLDDGRGPEAAARKDRKEAAVGTPVPG